MKEINVSKEQKVKLIEITNKLLPQLEIKWSSDPGSGGWDEYYLEFKSPEWFHDSIHWFEFCVYHLSYEIDRLNDDNCTELNWTNLLQSSHPIDYLYEQFLKIK